MASKRSKCGLSGLLFWGGFGLIFAFVLLLFLAMFLGLISYGSLEVLSRVLQEPEFLFALRFTLWTSLLAALLASAAALPCSYVLARCKFTGSSVVDTLLDMPIVLPPLVSGIALLILFGPVLGNSLAMLGLHIVFTPAGVIVAQWFIALPFAIKAFRQAFADIDPRLEKVARTLGFSPFQTFLRVTLPMARSGLISGAMLAWSRAMGEFGATAMLAGITRMKTETLSVAIFLNMSIGDIQFAIATSFIMLLIAFCLLVLLKTMARGIAVS